MSITTARELALTMVFAAVVLAVGLYPQPLLDVIRPAAEAWVGRLGYGNGFLVTAHC